MVVVDIEIEFVYFVEFILGSDPSVVYRISPPKSVNSSTAKSEE
jgi:hypothetical protein